MGVSVTKSVTREEPQHTREVRVRTESWKRVREERNHVRGGPRNGVVT